MRLRKTRRWESPRRSCFDLNTSTTSRDNHIVILMLILMGAFLLGACSRVVETKDEHVPAGTAEDSLQQELQENYIHATVEIACLDHHRNDPHVLTQATLAIYRQYGFDQVMDYLRLVKDMQSKKIVRDTIERETAKCL